MSLLPAKNIIAFRLLNFGVGLKKPNGVNTKGLHSVNGENFDILITNVANKRCKDSFSLLFNEFSGKIFGFGKNGRLNEAQSRELVQDVMTSVWSKASQFDPIKGSAANWIFTIARNARFDLYRKNVKEKNTLSADSIYEPGGHLDIEDTKVNLENDFHRAQLRERVSEFPDTQKDVIESIYFMGNTQEEYAIKNNLPLGTVKSRIRLAIRKLNQAMGES